jgi:hypothetical protein
MAPVRRNWRWRGVALAGRRCMHRTQQCGRARNSCTGRRGAGGRTDGRDRQTHALHRQVDGRADRPTHEQTSRQTDRQADCSAAQLQLCGAVRCGGVQCMVWRCSAVSHSAVQCSEVQSVHCSALETGVQKSAVECSTIQHSTWCYNTVQYTAQHMQGGVAAQCSAVHAVSGLSLSVSVCLCLCVSLPVSVCLCLCLSVSRLSPVYPHHATATHPSVPPPQVRPRTPCTCRARS